MIEIDIPGFGIVKLEHLVSDFTGTLSDDGVLIPKVDARLNKLAEVLKVHTLTADTFGKAQTALKASWLWETARMIARCSRRRTDFGDVVSEMDYRSPHRFAPALPLASPATVLSPLSSFLISSWPNTDRSRLEVRSRHRRRRADSSDLPLFDNLKGENWIY